jgi:hypothetical protein
MHSDQIHATSDHFLAYVLHCHGHVKIANIFEKNLAIQVYNTHTETVQTKRCNQWTCSASHIATLCQSFVALVMRKSTQPTS